jgi:hypothetical protein
MNLNEKELVALRAEIRNLRNTLDALKAHPVEGFRPGYAVLVASDLPPDYAVLVRSANALPPDYAVLVRNPRPPASGELARMPEYNVAVRPGLGALPPEYAVLVRPNPDGPEEVFVVGSLSKTTPSKTVTKTSKTKKSKSPK